MIVKLELTIAKTEIRVTSKDGTVLQHFPTDQSKAEACGLDWNDVSAVIFWYARKAYAPIAGGVRKNLELVKPVKPQDW